MTDPVQQTVATIHSSGASHSPDQPAQLQSPDQQAQSSAGRGTKMTDPVQQTVATVHSSGALHSPDQPAQLPSPDQQTQSSAGRGTKMTDPVQQTVATVHSPGALHSPDQPAQLPSPDQQAQSSAGRVINDVVQSPPEKDEVSSVKKLDMIQVAVGDDEYEWVLGYKILTKKELTHLYAKDPFWMKARTILFLLFWVTWFLMLASAVSIIVFAKKCPPIPEQKWFESALFYKVIPGTFKDSNANGIGDLNGIISKLDYLDKTLGVTALVLGPIYKQEERNKRVEDITNFKAIDLALGDMANFETLVSASHKRSMRLVLELSPFFTSTAHTWFKDKRDYYTWPEKENTEDGGLRWAKADGGDIGSNFHTFHGMPLLNIIKANKEVQEVFKFWLQKGVDGFHLNYMESFNFEEGSPYTPVLREWRNLVFNFSDESSRVLIGASHEAYDPSIANPLSSGEILDLVVFRMSASCGDQKDCDCDALCVNNLVQAGNRLANTSLSTDVVWAFRGMKRISGNSGVKYLDLWNTLFLTLGRAAWVYYGEEIGMTSKDENEGSMKDTGVMQWSPENNVGFTKMKMNFTSHDSKRQNVKTQLAPGFGLSHLEIFAKISEMRQSPAFKWGAFRRLEVGSNIYAFTRIATGFPGYLVALNFGQKAKTVDFYSEIKQFTPGNSSFATVMAVVHRYVHLHRARDLPEGKPVSLKNVHMEPADGFIFAWTEE